MGQIFQNGNFNDERLPPDSEFNRSMARNPLRHTLNVSVGNMTRDCAVEIV